MLRRGPADLRRTAEAQDDSGLPVSLPEVHRSVGVPATGAFLRRLLAFVGPGYLVAVGYMDPGNWATALAGGSAFGYTLLSVALLSPLMAMLLQALCARIGIATGRDLAQLCRDRFPRPVAWFRHGSFASRDVVKAPSGVSTVTRDILPLEAAP